MGLEEAQRTLQASIINILMYRFGRLPADLEEQIYAIQDTAVLGDLTPQAAVAPTLDDFVSHLVSNE